MWKDGTVAEVLEQALVLFPTDRREHQHRSRGQVVDGVHLRRASRAHTPIMRSVRPGGPRAATGLQKLDAASSEA